MMSKEGATLCILSAVNLNREKSSSVADKGEVYHLLLIENQCFYTNFSLILAKT